MEARIFLFRRTLKMRGISFLETEGKKKELIAHKEIGSRENSVCQAKEEWPRNTCTKI